MLVTLPILVARSWAASVTAAERPAASPQQALNASGAVHTVTCPLTGEQIPSCCCPVKN